MPVLERIDFSKILPFSAIEVLEKVVIKNTCPVCFHFPTVEETTGTDPQDIITNRVCPECHWTDRPQETKDFQKLMEEVPF